MLNKLNFTVTLDLFPAEILFSFGEDDTELTKTILDMGADLEDAKYIAYSGDNCFGKCIHFHPGPTVIRLREIPRTSGTIGAFQHELFHAVFFICKQLGMKLTKSSNETYAYMTGYLTEKVFENIANEEKRANARGRSGRTRKGLKK